MKTKQQILEDKLRPFIQKILNEGEYDEKGKYYTMHSVSGAPDPEYMTISKVSPEYVGKKLSDCIVIYVGHHGAEMMLGPKEITKLIKILQSFL